MDFTAAVQVLAAAPIRVGVVFGSQAEGRATAESDVDVGVVLEPGATLTSRAELDLGVALERALGREVDVVVLNDAGALLRREAARGVCIFEREEGAFGDFVSRALLEYDDFEPHFLRCARAMMRPRADGG